MQDMLDYTPSKRIPPAAGGVKTPLTLEEFEKEYVAYLNHTTVDDPFLKLFLWESRSRRWIYFRNAEEWERGRQLMEEGKSIQEVMDFQLNSMFEQIFE